MEIKPVEHGVIVTFDYLTGVYLQDTTPVSDIPDPNAQGYEHDMGPWGI